MTLSEAIHKEHIRLGFRSANCVHCTPIPRPQAEWLRRGLEGNGRARVEGGSPA